MAKKPAALYEEEDQALAQTPTLEPYQPLTTPDQIMQWRMEHEGEADPTGVKSPTQAPDQPANLTADSKADQIRQFREDPSAFSTPKAPDEPHSMVPEVAAAAGGMGLSQLGGPIVPLRALGAMAGGAGGYFAGDMYDIAQDPKQHYDWPRMSQAFSNAAKSGLMQGTGEMLLPGVGAMGGAMYNRMVPYLGQPMAYMGKWLSPASQRLKEAYQSTGLPNPMGSPLAGPGAGNPLAGPTQQGMPHPTAPGMQSQQMIDPDVQMAERMLERKNMEGGLMLSQRTPHKDEKSWASTLEGFSTGAGGGGDVVNRKRQISENLMEGILEEGQRMKDISFKPADVFYGRIRSQVGQQSIVEVYPILHSLVDPRNAELQPVVGLIRQRFALDPQRYGRLYQALEQNAQLQGAGTMRQALSFDDAVTLKNVFGELGYESGGNQTLASAARMYSEAIDNRIIQGLTMTGQNAQRLGPGGRNMGLPLQEQYLVAKRVDKNLHDTQRLGNMLVDLADPITGKMSAGGVTNAVSRYNRDELQQQIGDAGLKKLTSFQSILGMAERKSDETGRLVIAMNWAPAVLGAGMAAYDTTQMILGNEDASAGNMAQSGAKAGMILMTPKIIGKLLTNEWALNAFKRQVAFAARQPTQGMTARAVAQINASLVADATGYHDHTRPQGAETSMPVNPRTGAPRNPATMLPNPVEPQMAGERGGQAVNVGEGEPSLGSKIKLPLTPDEQEFYGRQISQYGQTGESAKENLRQVRKIMQADRYRDLED